MLSEAVLAALAKQQALAAQAPSASPISKTAKRAQRKANAQSARARAQEAWLGNREPVETHTETWIIQCMVKVEHEVHCSNCQRQYTVPNAYVLMQLFNPKTKVLWETSDWPVEQPETVPVHVRRMAVTKTTHCNQCITGYLPECPDMFAKPQPVTIVMYSGTDTAPNAEQTTERTRAIKHAAIAGGLTIADL